MERKTNWMAIIVAAVAGMALGFLWYGLLFQEQWMAGNGITLEGEKMFKNGAEIPMSSTPMLVNTLAMLLYAVVMNWLMGRMGVGSYGEGATAGAAIGLVMTVGVWTGNLFANNPGNLTLVDGSYSFILFTVIGAIVGGWQKK